MVLTSTNEELIVDFIKKEPFSKDRLLLIECISKLSNAGLYIESIDQLLNYVQEAILYKYDFDEENEEDYVAKWYWSDSVKYGEDPWKPYDFSTCKILEKALKYDIDSIRINSTYFVNVQTFYQRRYNSPSKRKVKREKAKLERIYENNETTTTTTDDSTTSNDNNNNNNNNNNNVDDVIPFVQWYWADDGPKGYQNDWKKYSEELCIKLEKQFINNGNEKIRVDSERYVDTRTMLQVRYDNKARIRMVKRELSQPIKSPSKINLLYNMISKFTPSASPAKPSLSSTISKTPPPPHKVSPRNKKDRGETMSLILTEELEQALSYDQAKFLLRKFKNPAFSKQTTPQHSVLLNHTLNTFRNVISRNNSILQEKQNTITTK